MFAVFFFFFFFFFLFFFLRELIFAKISILPTRCFKQFLCSQRLASTFGKSLSAVFVASSNSAWRYVESVINAISHFSLWSKTLHCWQKLSKSTNQRVYQDLVYRNALLLKILTSVPAPLSPVLLYFSSLSLLRTALHNLNAWNRLRTCGRKLLPTDSSRPLFKQIEIFFWHTDCIFQL